MSHEWRLIRKVFIHDPDYFALNSNPLALTNKMLTLNPQSVSVYVSLALREHMKLDTPKNPRMEDSDYMSMKKLTQLQWKHQKLWWL